MKKNILDIQGVIYDPSAGMIKRLFRHLLAGSVGTLLYIASTALFVEYLYFHPVVAVICSFSILMVLTYIINRTWVYSPSRGHEHSIPRFLTVVCISLGLNSGIMFLVFEVFDLWYFYGLIITVFIVPPTNFLLNYYWAFK